MGEIRGLDDAGRAAGSIRNIILLGMTVVGSVGGAATWLNGKIAEQIAVAKAEVLVQVNLTRCAVLEIGPLDCDVYEGVDP